MLSLVMSHDEITEVIKSGHVHQLLEKNFFDISAPFSRVDDFIGYTVEFTQDEKDFSPTHLQKIVHLAMKHAF